MNCKNCGQDNPAEARFCGGCGAALAATVEPRISVSTSQINKVLPAAIAEYAGFWRRLAAFLIDILIIQTANMVLLPGSGLFIRQITALNYAIIAPLFALLPWLYFWLFTGLKGQTPGKMALGIRVAGNERKLGLGTAALREIAGKTISLVPVFLGFLWMLWDSEQQGWHDKIAHTHVVRVTNGR